MSFWPSIPLAPRVCFVRSGYSVDEPIKPTHSYGWMNMVDTSLPWSFVPRGRTKIYYTLCVIVCAPLERLYALYMYVRTYDLISPVPHAQQLNLIAREARLADSHARFHVLVNCLHSVSLLYRLYDMFTHEMLCIVL